MMATAAPMSHSQSNKKLGNMAQDCFTDGMIDHDMHLKMSKKIAQLTKVIYALNTKNDEHEHIMKAVQQQHDKDKQQMLSEFKLKLERFQNKLGVETDLRRKIESLEQNIEEYERQKKTLLNGIEEMKKQWTDREASLQAEYNQRMSTLSRQVEQDQSDFEKQVNTFESLITEFEQQKKDVVSEMKKCHQLEMDNLLKAQRNQATGLEDELDQLKQKHAEEIEHLKAAYNGLKTSSEVTQSDYEEKLNKMKLFYEKEMELLKNSQSQSFSERETFLQEKLDKLTKDLQFQEVQSRKRIEGLLEEASHAEASISELQSQIEQLQRKQLSQEEQIATLTNQLKSAEEARDQYSEQYKETKSSHDSLVEQHREQTHQLNEKLLTIQKLTEIKSENENKIQSLAYELTDAKRNLKLLEEEKDSLMSKSNSDSKQKSSQVKALEEALEELRIEKQALKDKYDVDLVGMERRLKETEDRARAELAEQSDKLHADHELSITSLKQQQHEAIHTLEQEWKTRMDAEITTLQDQLKLTKQQLEELSQQMGDKTSNLGAATEELSSLRKEIKSLQLELETAKSEVEKSTHTIQNLQEEIDKLTAERKQLIADHRTDVTQQLDELRSSLEGMWAERLQKETSQLRSELMNNYETERAMTLDELSSRKERELSEITRSYKEKISLLNAKILELEGLIKRNRLSAEQQLRDTEAKHMTINQELKDRLDAALSDYEKKIAELRAEAEAALLEKLEAKSMELEACLTEAKTKHMEEIMAQMTAHKATIDMVKRENESQRLAEQHEQRERLEQEKQALKADLLERHRKEVENSSNAFMKQMTALRMEIQRASEINKQKEGEMGIMKEDYDERLANRDQSIRNLQSDLTDLENTIQKLNKEIDAKGKEILQVRSDANNRIRAREKALAEEHVDEMDSLVAQHNEETQQVLLEFTKAQTILKERIEELSLSLEEAEERYRNREPREQDLDMIEQLRHTLAEREQQMQQLLADKQYYQMELVNRETNFTKVFAGGEANSATPQVGFINPLAKKKKGEKGATKYTTTQRGGANGSGSVSSPGSSAGTQQRLRPIAGSPIHDEKLNPNHVLPPPQAFTRTKKFVQ